MAKKKVNYEAMKAARTKNKMTPEQRAWCKLYREQTTFEPLMDDFLYGNESFLDAARTSNRWFEDWSSDAYLNISRHIPGEEEEELAVVATDRGNAR